MNGPVINAVVTFLGLLTAMHFSVTTVLSFLNYRTIEKYHYDYYDNRPSKFTWKVSKIFSKTMVGTEALSVSSSISLIILLVYVFVKYLY